MDIKILLEKGVPICLSCVGFSMQPLIKENDKVLIKKSDNYCKGEIVAYCFAEKIFVHRIINKNKDNFYEIRGDSQVSSHFIEEKQILGKIEAVYKKDKIIYLKKNITKNHYMVLLRYLYLVNVMNNFYLKIIKKKFFKNSKKNSLLFIKNIIKYLEQGLTKFILRITYETKT